MTVGSWQLAVDSWKFLKDRKLQIFFPYILSLLLAVPCWILLPDYFPKYHARLVESGFIDKPGGFEYYEDLDHDGFSERIILFTNTLNQASVKIMGSDGSILDHYYFRGQMIRQHGALSICDYDSSGISRLFIFTVRNDSLFLNGVDPVRKKDVEFRDRYIALVVPKNGTYDFQIQMVHFTDLNGDKCKELITSIMAGFPLEPRIGVIVDLVGDSVFRSADRGDFFYISTVRDINEDGKKELIPCTYSIYNYPDSAYAEVNDHQARIMVFDDRFNCIFPPVNIPGKYIHTNTFPVLTRSGQYHLVSLVTQKTSEPIYPRLILLDLSGKQIATRQLPDINRPFGYSMFSLDEYPNSVFLIHGNEILEEIDADLKSVRTIVLDQIYTNYYYSFDADMDGKNEHIGSAGFMRAPIIFRNDFTHPVILDLPATAAGWLPAVKYMGNNSSGIFIQQGDNYYLFSYGRNFLFFLKYPFYLCIFLGFLAIVLGSQYLQRIFLKQRQEAVRTIAELQLKVLNNQIDPHFTFNAISSISASILQDRPEEANRNLHALSWLMRSCVSHSDKLSRSLGEELSFVNQYLDLMKTRMNGGFDYVIEVAPEVDISWEVPKMGIQIYAENAVKHGLRPKGAGGQLKITVAGLPEDRVSGLAEGELQGSAHPHFATSLFRYFAIYIEDNGIGRKQAKLTGSSGTGKGMEIMEQFYATFNRFNKQKIGCEITDLEDEAGNALGTRVEITIPVGMKYTL